MDKHTYTMKISLGVIDHFGKRLYSNVAAVLTEAVANAWDADAENVEIEIGDDEITISDDGIGMSVDDMNEKYLLVGYQCRENAERTKKGRMVMGRKGLGKLSLFSIADVIEICTVCENDSPHGLRMDIKEIERKRKSHGDYNPTELKPDELPPNHEKGTRILLKELGKKRLKTSATALRKKLARRFSVIGKQHNFAVKINGDPITMQDRDDFLSLQFIWTIGDSKSKGTTAVAKNELTNRNDGWDENWKVKGWIGTVEKPQELKTDGGNLNSIVVLARGRSLKENILDELDKSDFYTEYLTGQIEADFLDDSDKEDIAISNRQGVVEHDERYEKICEFLKQRLEEVGRQWNQLRGEHQSKKEKKNYPPLQKWIDSLPNESIRRSANELISKLSTLKIDKEDDRIELYRYGILAFERLRLRDEQSQLGESISKGNVSKLLALLADKDSFEASLYRDIIKRRIDTIKNLKNLVDAKAKEKALQKFLFDHLWLLDPAWERAVGSEEKESTLITKVDFVDGMSEEELRSRVDIAYRTIAGEHIIVELKRADAKVKLIDLQRQGQLYVDKLKKLLLKRGKKNPDIEVVFVLGEPVDEQQNDPNRYKSSMDAIAQGSRIVCYDQLINNAKQAYEAYLEKSSEVDSVDKILTALSELKRKK